MKCPQDHRIRMQGVEQPRSRSRGRVGVILLLIGVVAASCSTTIDVTFTPIKDFVRSARSAAEVELYMKDDPPVRPHAIVGSLFQDLSFDTLSRQVPTQAERIAALRKAAAANGLDGVRDVYFPPVGTVGSNTITGNGFVYSR